MGFSVLFLLFGLAAAFAFFSDSSSAAAEEMDTAPPDDDIDDDGSGSATPPSDDDLSDEERELERIRLTGQGNDDNNLIVARDGLTVYSGLGGNDTMIGSPDAAVMLLGGDGDDTIIAYDGDIARGGFGNDLLLGEHLFTAETPQTLNGGPGNDTIISYGGSEMTGGDGQDTFIISPMGIDPATGAFLSASNAPLPIIRITDFNADEDVLVLDLIRSYDGFAQAESTAALIYDDDRVAAQFGESVVINAQPVVGGTLVLVNETPFVVVQGLTPDQLANDGVLQVNGAQFTFGTGQQVA
jgi:Ca2+-binding RTX toxin-like protein